MLITAATQPSASLPSLRPGPAAPSPEVGDSVQLNSPAEDLLFSQMRNLRAFASDASPPVPAARYGEEVAQVGDWPGTTNYKSPDEAAGGAFNLYGPLTRQESKEYGGFVYRVRQDGVTSYRFTDAVTPKTGNIGPDFNGYLEGAPNNFQQLQELFAKKYPGAELVGMYHTHPYFEGYTNETFSDYDKKMGKRFDPLDQYLLTADGHALRWSIDHRPVRIGDVKLTEPQNRNAVTQDDTGR